MIDLIILGMDEKSFFICLVYCPWWIGLSVLLSECKIIYGQGIVFWSVRNRQSFGAFLRVTHRGDGICPCWVPWTLRWWIQGYFPWGSWLGWKYVFNKFLNFLLVVVEHIHILHFIFLGVLEEKAILFHEGGLNDFELGIN